MATLPHELRTYVDVIAASCRGRYRERLSSVVLFGSVARGRFHSASDVDLLLVLRDSAVSVGKRITEFVRTILDDPELETTATGLQRRGLPWRVEPVILTEAQLASHPPLLLDLTEDAVVLEDRDGVFAREIVRVRQRLCELGARRVWLDEDRWYWVLTPEIRLGDVITI